VSDRIRFLVADFTLGAENVLWDIDVEVDGVWIDAFDGDLYPDESAFPPKWRHATFEQGLATRMRFRYTRQGPGNWRGAIYEADFRDVTAL